MNYPPGVTGREAYFDPPDEPDPLGECGGCDKLVLEGEDWVDRDGVLWHEDCLPDEDPPRRPPRPDEVYARVVAEQHAEHEALKAKAEREGVSCLDCWDRPTPHAHSFFGIDPDAPKTAACSRCGVHRAEDGTVISRPGT